MERLVVNEKRPLFRYMLPGLIVILSATLPVNGQQSRPDDIWLAQEFRYVEELQSLRLPDYADKVMARIKFKHPGATAQIKVLELQGLLSMGEFEKVQTIINKEGNQKSEETWAMKLTLADGYYMWGKYKEAQVIYDSLFNTYPGMVPSNLNDFYLESAHKYAQMLLYMGEHKQALQAYDYALRTRMEKHKKRQIQIERAEIMIKLAETAERQEQIGYFNEIKKICDEIFWVQDVWFSKAIVIMAHMKVLEGDISGAMKLVDDYWPQLKSIDEQLKEGAESEEEAEELTRLSPVAEGRYLIGVVMQKEANRLISSGGNRDKIIALLAGEKKDDKKTTSGALQHFLNVFVQYPDTPWAPDAAERFKDVKGTLAKAGIGVNPKIPADAMVKIRNGQFQQALMLFNRAEFEKASETYLTVLNLFPEGSDAISGLGKLAECYIKLGGETNAMYATMVAGYIAERFGKNRLYIMGAGNQLLRLATVYGEEKRTDEKKAVYDIFFSHCLKHPRTAGLLMGFGNEKYAAGDFDGAVEYYKQIANNHSDSPIYPEAVSRIADIHAKAGDHAEEIKTLAGLIQTLEGRHEPGHALIKAKFREAYAYKQMGEKYIGAAIKRFSELISMLADGGRKYGNSEEELKANRRILEASLFYKAYSYSRITKPEDKLAAYKQYAGNMFMELVDKFPESEFAPAALGQAGTILTLLDKGDEARKVLMRLKDKYPNSAEAKNSAFILANNLLNMGRRQEAVRLFKEMFEGSGAYSDAQILTAGRELLKAGEQEIAIEAFDKVLASSENAAFRERSLLMKGEALSGMRKFEEAVKTLEDLCNEFPTSVSMIKAAEWLSVAYAELGGEEQDADKRFEFFNQSILAMKKVRQRTSSLPDRADLDIKVAKIYLIKKAAEEKFGRPEGAKEALTQSVMTYQSLVLFSDAEQTGIKPYLEKAYYECIPLLIEMERWQEAVDNCNEYLELFGAHDHSSEVRVWSNKVKIKMSTTGIQQNVTIDEKKQE